MHTLALSMAAALILAVLPLSVSAQQQSPQEPVDPHHMDMMQEQGMGGDTGMGTGGAVHGCCMESHGKGMGGGQDGSCMEHHGKGMMGGHGGGDGMMFPGPLRMLDLNVDQRTRIYKIELDLRKQLWTLKGNTFDAESQLNDLYSADRPDPKKIGAVYAKIFDVRRQMIEAKLDAMNRARDVLNKEQLEKLKQLRQSPHDWSDFD